MKKSKEALKVLITSTLLVILSFMPILANELNIITDYDVENARIDILNELQAIPYEELWRIDPYFVPLSEEEIEMKVQESVFRAEQMLLRSRSTSSNENWILRGTRTLVPTQVMGTRFHRQLATNETLASSSWGISIGSGTVFRGVPIDGSVSFNSPQRSWAGPSFSDVLPNGLAATHSYVISAFSGNIVEATWDIHDRFTGNFLRTVRQNIYTNTGVAMYNSRAHIGNGITVIIENSTRNRIRTFVNHNTLVNSFGNDRTDALFF